MGDPLAEVAQGWRVVWMHELGHELIVLDEDRIMIADADLSRECVARAIRSLCEH